MLLLFTLVALSSLAQQPVPAEAEYPYRRDIEKGKYERAAEKIARRLDKDPANLECHYAAYHLYASEANPAFNPDSAYSHLQQVRAAFLRADSKALERWARDSYSAALLDYSFRQISELALAQAHLAHTPDAYQHFLSYYALAPDDVRLRAEASRDTIEYRIAVNAGSLDMIQSFIQRRPSSTLMPEATHLRDSMAFQAFDRQHTVAAYSLFCSSYPQSHLISRAVDSIYQLDFRDVRRLDTEQYYRSYAERYPLSPFAKQTIWLADSIEFHREVIPSDWHSYTQYLDARNRPAWRDTATTHLAHFALAHLHVDAAEQALRRMPASSHLATSLALMLHDAYIGTSIRNFGRFYSQYPSYLPQAMQTHDSLAYELNAHYHFHIADSCIRAIAPSHEALVMLQQLLKDDIDHHRFDNAIATAKQYAPFFRNDYEYLQLLSTLSSDFSSPHQPAAFPATVNTPKGDEFAPVLTADGSTLFFAGKNRPDNIGGEDVFVAHRAGSSWGKAYIEMTLSHTYGNESPLSVSPDGNTLLLFQSGTLYRADRTAQGWTKQQMPAQFNSSSWQSDMMLAANGRVIFFAAYGRTCREVDSSLNIYVSLLGDDGQWSQPVELGSSVNTQFDERSPYLHPDMKTLYFASEGHGSMGQMDMFMVTRLDDTYTRWSAPINIGRMVNTTDDDWGYKISTDGTKCFFSRRDASMNIYSCPLPSAVAPQPVTSLTGSVVNLEGNPLSASICWEDASIGQLLGSCITDPQRGAYHLVLPQGVCYRVYVSHPDYFPTSLLLDLTDPSASASQTHVFRTTPLSDMVESSIPLTLNTITFHIASKQMVSTSTAELLHLAKLLKQHRYRAEISVHLDGTPGNADNLVLTQGRAEEILQYLIDHGVPADLVSAEGKGSDKPIQISNKVSSKTARPQNRRVEIRLY